MSDFSYDLVVIGSGPAGEGAAINAVKQGWRVAVVDERAHAGGSCTHANVSGRGRAQVVFVSRGHESGE